MNTHDKRRGRGKRRLVWALAFFGAIQLVPYGRAHTNPPVVQEPAWDSTETRDTVRAACFDCHSNETRWPAYANIAPGSWLLQHDVNEGRSKLNFSEFQRPQQHAKDAAEEVRTRGMPQWYYGPLHAKARLSDADRERLARGLEKTFGPAQPHPAR